MICTTKGQLPSKFHPLRMWHEISCNCKDILYNIVVIQGGKVSQFLRINQ